MLIVKLIFQTIIIGNMIGVFFFFRPVYVQWQARWGATDEEVNQSMAGDDILKNPVFNATRAVTIKASPEEIWAWIIQMGYKRAGFYSYDRLDNDGIPSADHIIPKYQSLKVGDLIHLSKNCDARVTALEPHRNLALEFECSVEWTWAWRLYQVDEHHTRLITRLRVQTKSIMSRFMLDTFEIVMMRKCMLGIKHRAESAHQPQI